MRPFTTRSRKKYSHAFVAVVAWFVLVSAPCGMGVAAVGEVPVDENPDHVEVVHDHCLTAPADSSPGLENCCDATLALKSDGVKIPKVDAWYGAACFLQAGTMPAVATVPSLSTEYCSQSTSLPLYLATLRLRI